MPDPRSQDLQERGRHYITFTDFEGMDTQSDRVALDPRKLAWCENLQPIGKNQLTLVPGPDSPVLSVAGGLSLFRGFYANIFSYSFVQGSNGNFAVTQTFKDVLIVVSNLGAMFEINLATNQLSTIASNGTVQNPDVTQWKSERVLIADPQLGYASWDGFSLTHAGTVSPNVTITATGGFYTAPPSISITGASGTGVQAYPILTNVTSGFLGGIVVVNTNASNYTGPLTVTFTPNVGGSAATAVVWPTLTFSINAPLSTLAVFAGRVWLGAGRILEWTGTAGYDDFSPANASGLTQLTDADLIHQITALRSLNNYLYIFGDNAIKQIGSVTVQTSTTQFTLVTLSSDQGTTFAQTIRSYNRLILFANKVGVFAIFGASVEKVSDAMDGIFANGNFLTFPMQAAVTDLNSIHTYLLLVQFNDPYTGIQRTLILALMGKKWFVINAGNALQMLVSSSLAGRYVAYVSSGPDVTPILAKSFIPVSYLLRTALAADRKPMMGKRALRALVGQALQSSTSSQVLTESENGVGDTINYTGNAVVTWVNNSGQAVGWLNNSGFLIFWVSKGYLMQPMQAQASGIYLGATVSGTAAQLKIISVIVEYQDDTAMRSSNTGA